MKYFVIDTFTEKLFSGNPAGVCLLERAEETEKMQKIAAENNLAETAFLLYDGKENHLRWFSPKIEIDLCGHATLASAYVIMNYVDSGIKEVAFGTQSGILTVKREGDRYVMSLPRIVPKKLSSPEWPEWKEKLEKALGACVEEIYLSRDVICIMKDEKTVAELNPDIEKLSEIPVGLGICPTARGEKYDFISRFFAPKAGVDEDPVTGSVHSALIPLWAKRLGKKEMTALQLSPRKGTLYCADRENDVLVGGKAVLFMRGETEV